MARERRPLSQSGAAASQHLKGHSSCRGWCTNQGQAECCAHKLQECPIHASPPCASHWLISLLSSSFLLSLGRPAFLATFGILLNTCDLWPLPSGPPTHLSPQLLPLLNSVRLAPPPVIKRRTFQVDPFPLPRSRVASPGARQVSGPWHASGGWRQSQNLTLLWFS